MKLVLDEKSKHRLVGISVILSLGAIFLPAMLKKSSQRLENHFSVNVKLPPKPVAPSVAVADEEQMFKTIKIAKVKPSTTTQNKVAFEADQEDFIAAVPAAKEEIRIAQAKSASPVAKPIELALKDAAKLAVKKEVQVAAAEPVKPTKVVQPAKAKVIPKPVLAKIAPKSGMKRDIYAVQLASFSKLANAQSLVTKLQTKGYKANYTRTAGRNGVIYKVYVGHSPIKEDVVKLRTQLASAMQLNGFVVNTGVS